MKKKSLFGKIIGLGVAGAAYVVYSFVAPADINSKTQSAQKSQNSQKSIPTSVPQNQESQATAQTYVPLPKSQPQAVTKRLTKYEKTNERIAKAFRNHNSDLMVESKGRVVKVLRDDIEGSRHQRFLLRLSNDHTILVSHNIDLAPRIPYLDKGDVVKFKGEYEWNNKGGVVHWTHLDPRRRHENGWLEHSGKRYQ